MKTSSTQQQTLGTVTEFTIEAPQLNRSKTIWVYLPYNYEDSNQRFPVIYMHDGQHVFDHAESEKRDWHVEDKLNVLHSQAIIIGIEHGGSNRRIDEMTPYKNEKYGGGNADNYLDFIVKTLKPHIDKNYRTKTKAKNTTIMGSSLGGLVSYYAILKYPEVFGKAGVFSPSFWFSKDIYTLTEQAPKNKTKIYFLCGDKESDDMVAEMKKMETLLDHNRCYCLHLTKDKIVKGGEHNEKLWRDGFVDAILWLGY